jgi:glycosyltransferase involved in cell wall biosynthesis
MHVLINAASANMGGALTYLINVGRLLPTVAQEDRFTIVLPARSREKLEAFGPFPNIELIDYPHTDTGGVARYHFDQVEIPRMVRRKQADALFSSTGFGTYMSPCPQILLVRNPVYFSREFHQKYRELGRSLRRNTMRRYLSLASIRAADETLFPTKAMQDMVQPYIDLTNRRTRVLPYGFDHEAFSRGKATVPGWRERFETWKSEGYELLLNVSTYAVHKNFETLIEALPHVKAGGRKVKLLTTTSREKTSDKAEYDAMVRRAEALGVKEDWVELGYVPYEALHALYAAADLYVFPSFTESFGHSLVEAMAAGLPVAAADMPVNREVCGEAGRYFDTFDPGDCARVVEDVLGDAEVRRQLSDASRVRARDFSWPRYTAQLVELFREVAHRR